MLSKFYFKIMVNFTSVRLKVGNNQLVSPFRNKKSFPSKHFFINVVFPTCRGPSEDFPYLATIKYIVFCWWCPVEMWETRCSPAGGHGVFHISIGIYLAANCSRIREVFHYSTSTSIHWRRLVLVLLVQIGRHLIHPLWRFYSVFRCSHFGLVFLSV